ncbi:hypothetical protein Pmar_PMAR001558 [Perkinsus marinus ATCC 50983]|uniref:Stress-response A/B barrel domain-containing protein n=1 Tax=Perkinsus marinus (strain ATCC 50983 / TXsc) TaxID=423536 RepID=C5K4L0_PERM5|nr:hypothetical protein Pmar_PMAR001558 [Perkinsus marinus ATCC 50983]EER20577.1 hypothetical protein Pmar_PMAR001558 [Perkinsus marinus ATCC 50983]|eukprot:XP_002788781.1 hypothetical protein Pmar_PMAR001558 [Perkinsus marinus ATCC 50983]
MAGVTHMVAFKLKEDASEEAIQRLVDSCKTLGDLPIVKDITVHRDMGLDKERNHHMMFLVKFNTIEDYREYSTHPVHMEIMRTILLPILEPEETIDELTAKCLSMEESIPAIKSIQVHRDLGLDPARNQDFMLVVCLQDVEAYQNYASHPVIPSFYVMPAICIVLGIGDYFTLESLILAVSNTVCLVCEHYECLTIFDV